LTSTQTFTSTQTYTSTATPVPEPYSVTVNIYNSAGELVRSLYNGDSANPANQAQILETATTNDGLQVDIAGLDGDAGANLIWNGTNNNGQAVASGVYTVQISSVNTFGQVQTQTKAVSIVATGGPVTLSVYNSAGELVTNLSVELSAADGGSQPIGISLPSGQNGVVPSTNTSGPGELKINVTLADGNTVPVYWNGLNTQGQPLQSGNYLLTLTQTEAGSSEILKTLPVVVVDTPDLSAQAMVQTALVVPNPVAGSWFDVQYQTGGPYTAAGMLYDLAGQRVAEATDQGGGILRFSGDWSSGVYLLDFEARNGDGVLARKVLKVAIVR
jgi:flagellar hook assembly protein FlgD